MGKWTRRGFLAASAAQVAACDTFYVKNAAEIDAEVAASRQLLFQTVPGTEGLASRASGVLIIPKIVKGGFIVGGAYGEGALLVGEAIVDYISVSAASVGFQIGAQSFSQALFFMTPEVLRAFRVTDGWQLGVDAEVTVLDEGVAASATSNTVSRPVYDVVYGQRGLIVGASLEGAKYSRLIR